MIIYVNSFEEAKAYPVMFNTSEIFLDANQDKFYCKSVDKMGKFTMGTYTFQQVENEKPLTSADFVPREQFDALSSKLDNLIAILASQEQPKPQSQPQQKGKKGVNNNGKQSDETNPTDAGSNIT